jgi:hypothetical protein
LELTRRQGLAAVGAAVAGAVLLPGTAHAHAFLGDEAVVAALTQEVRSYQPYPQQTAANHIYSPPTDTACYAYDSRPEEHVLSYEKEYPSWALEAYYVQVRDFVKVATGLDPRSQSGEIHARIRSLHAAVSQPASRPYWVGREVAYTKASLDSLAYRHLRLRVDSVRDEFRRRQLLQQNPTGYFTHPGRILAIVRVDEGNTVTYYVNGRQHHTGRERDLMEWASAITTVAVGWVALGAVQWAFDNRGNVQPEHLRRWAQVFRLTAAVAGAVGYNLQSRLAKIREVEEFFRMNQPRDTPRLVKG